MGPKIADAQKAMLAVGYLKVGDLYKAGPNHAGFSADDGWTEACYYA